MSVNPVIRQKEEVMVHFVKAQEFSEQGNWFAAFDELAVVLGWDWPIRGCDDVLHMRLQDHMVLTLSKTKKYEHMESWCRRFLEQRKKTQNLDATQQGLHDRRTRYIRTELASALQSQYDPESEPPTGDIGKCWEAIGLLEDYIFDFSAAPEDELFCKKVLAECFSKVGRHAEAIGIGSWVYERQSSNHSQLDTKVIDARYNLAVYYSRKEDYEKGDELFLKNIGVIKNSGDQLIGATPEWHQDLERNTRYWLGGGDSDIDGSEFLPVGEESGEYVNDLNPMPENTLSPFGLSQGPVPECIGREENILINLEPALKPEANEEVPVQEDTSPEAEKISQILQPQLVEIPNPDKQVTIEVEVAQGAEKISPNIHPLEIPDTHEQPPIPEDIPWEAKEISPKLQSAEITGSHDEEKPMHIACVSRLPFEIEDSSTPVPEDTIREVENISPNLFSTGTSELHEQALVLDDEAQDAEIQFAGTPYSNEPENTTKTSARHQLPLELEDNPAQIRDNIHRTDDASPNSEFIEILNSDSQEKATQISDTPQLPSELDYSPTQGFKEQTKKINATGASQTQPINSSKILATQTFFPSNEPKAETLGSNDRIIINTEPSSLANESESALVPNTVTRNIHLAPPTIQISSPTPPPSPPFKAKPEKPEYSFADSKVHTSPADARDKDFQSLPTLKENQSSIVSIHDAGYMPFHDSLPTPQSSAESLPIKKVPAEGSSPNRGLNSAAEKQYDSCTEPSDIEPEDEDAVLSDHSPDSSDLDYRNAFFGAENETTRNPDAKSWIKKFASVREKLFPLSYRGAKVKIAILDTGIDNTHPYIQKWEKPTYGKKVGEKEIDLQGGKWYKDFVSKRADPVDLDGHGTHVAGIILQFAPDAELYIARIAKSSASIAEDKGLAKKVAGAIEHAIDFWGVDIISMSFGFADPEQDELILLNRAIWKAQGEQVILMAAASNHGNLTEISFPARHRDVLCINASNPYARPLPFSPQIESKSHDFSILGLDVMSTWPEFPKLDKDSKRKQGAFCPKDTDHKGPEGTWKCLSGTSVATPMAAALAAIVFQYTRKHLEPNLSIAMKEASRYECLDGLTRIFRAMSRQDETGVLHLVPWEGEGGRFKHFENHMTQILKYVFNIWD